MNLKKVILIGGSPCSGKSTISNYIGEKYAYQVIHSDDYMFKHIEEANELKHPIMFKWQKSKWHELFSRDVDIQFQEEILFFEEEFNFLKRDIINDIKSDKVIIEGAALMPHLIDDLFENQEIIYLIPSKDFQLEKYDEREWAKHLLSEAPDPSLAFENWMNRDIEFAKYISKKASEKGYKVLLVDGKRTLKENINLVVKFFSLS